MSHELTQTNGKTEFAYLESDGLPRHGLGTAMPDGAPLHTEYEMRQAIEPLQKRISFLEAQLEKEKP
jgi:hypothetical protein